MSNFEKYSHFRSTFPEMTYDEFSYDVQPDGLHIAFLFRIGEKVDFRPTAFIPARPFLDMRQPREVMDRLVFNIGMVELVSYWKSLCPKTIHVKCGGLDESQKAFWRKLYWNGLGEFFYVNGIQETEETFFEWKIDQQEQPGISDRLPLDGQRYIVPIGGGKDSVVTLEALSQHHEVRPLIMNPRGATLECAAKAGFGREDIIEIRRTIDPALLDLNAKGCLNGHTPFSAMLAFYTLLASRLSGIGNVALSNESSANESTVVGTMVNHQYSKSLEFENDFRGYVRQYVCDSRYFSFLRPLSELQIAMLFARHEKYFDVFKSCNVGSKQDIWCGHCAKCLFAYIILSPFIEPDRLNGIFGKNMLDDPALRYEFEQLVGRAETKPFECVGTISEVNSALAMTLQKWYPSQRPQLLRGYEPQPPVTPLRTLFPESNLTPSESDILQQCIDSQF